MRATSATLAGFGLSATLVLTGCIPGSESEAGPKAGQTGNTSETRAATTPKQKLAAAFTNLGDSSSLSVSLGLDATRADLKKIARAQPRKSADMIDRSDIRDLRPLLGGAVTMHMVAGDGLSLAEASQVSEAQQSTMQDLQDLLKDPAALEAAMEKSGAFSMAVRKNDTGLVEFVTKSGVLYLRGEVDQIAAELDLGDVSEAEGMLGQLPPSIATPARAAIQGDWISLDLVETVKALDEQGLLDQLPQEVNPTPSADQEKALDFFDSLGASLEADSEVSEIEATDQGEGYRVRVPIRKVAKAVQKDVGGLLGKSAGREFRDIFKDLPMDTTIAFDVFVEDEKLSAVSLDVAQFLSKPVDGAKLAFELDVDADAGEVQVPGDATPVDVKAILNSIPPDTFNGLTSGV